MDYSELKKITSIAVTLFLIIACKEHKAIKEVGVQQWEKVTLSFEGPQTSENAETNPFLDYLLEVEFTNGDTRITLEGFYAADGNAAETSASSGNIWNVRFRPDKAGTWTYKASLLKGKEIAIAETKENAEQIELEESTGSIEVLEVDGETKGRLVADSGRYLRYSNQDSYFLKHGAGSPENLLAYVDFDDTYRQRVKDRKGESKASGRIHHYSPHLKDWETGNPVWKKDKGKALIGGINYLASQGLNSVYFLTLNIQGDGEDVWPYTAYDERTRFDCSKLDQWEIVFDHIDNKGMMLHFITQETENELLLNDGETGLERKLYYRELIARFGHHRKVTWNMGEENGWAKFTPKAQNTAQRKKMFDYFKRNDPYFNPVVLHSHHYKPERDSVYYPLLGYDNLDGMSAQISFPHQVHEVTKEWISLSKASGRPWIISVDEIGPAERGVDPDDREDNNHDNIRKLNIWGHFMAGGAGVEWYFGYKNHSNDLNMEDWRSRDSFWKYGRIAVSFFQDHLPFSQMESHDELVHSKAAYCFAKPGEIYSVYLPTGQETQLSVESPGPYSIQWFNPRKGGELLNRTVSTVTGNKPLRLGSPPISDDEDWVVLIKKLDSN